MIERFNRIIQEALIKVPENTYKSVEDFVRRFFIKSFLEYFENILEKNDAETLDLIYDREYAFYKKLKNIDTSDINEYFKPEDKLLHITITIDEHIPRYPNAEPFDLILVINITERLGGFYTKVKIEDNTEANHAIFLEIPPLFSELGKNKDGEPVYSFELINFERILKGFQPILKHEFMHLVQHTNLKDYFKDKKVYNPFSDYENYMASDIEFSPLLYTQIEKYIDLDDKPSITDYVKSNSYFKILKAKNPKGFKKALSVFYKEVTGKDF